MSMVNLNREERSGQSDSEVPHSTPLCGLSVPVVTTGTPTQCQDLCTYVRVYVCTYVCTSSYVQSTTLILLQVESLPACYFY